MHITVSEATPDGLFRVVTSLPTTADMTVMTPGGLAVFYPHWTLKKIALVSHRMMRAKLVGQEQGIVWPSVGCAGKSDFSMERSTNFLEEACRARCPSLWQNVADKGAHMLVMEWDNRFSMKSLVNRSQTMWPLALYCQNRFCCYNPNNNAHTTSLPVVPAPGNLTRIQLQEAEIEEHRPVGVVNPGRFGRP